MNEGQFPRAVREDSILSDSERKALRDHQIDIESDSQRRLFDENLLAYLAFTRASERLILTRATTDESGRPIAPSVFWRDLRELFSKEDRLVTSEIRDKDAIVSSIKEFLGKGK